MKKMITLLTLCIIALQSFAQLATFEKFITQKDTFLNGKSVAPAPKQFTDSGFSFSTTYDTSFGGYWSKGFAISSMTDTTDGTSSNLYSSVTASGTKGSRAYAVAQNNAQFRYDILTTGNSTYLSSMDITNTFYAANVIKNGNQFSRAFTGANKDSFVLWIYQYFVNGFMDSTRVDLADFTQNDSTKNYILKTWKTVEFPSIVPTDSIRFKLVSSDNNSFGMNTPAFFAIDNIKANGPNSTNKIDKNAFKVYPNPVQDFLSISGEIYDIINIQMTSITGQMIAVKNSNNKVNTSNLEPGIYFLNIITPDGVWQERIIKY